MSYNYIMKLTPKDIEELRTILSVCKTLGIEGIILNEGRVRGAKPSLDVAIISDTNLSISEALRVGIGRVSELDKRLGIFGADINVDGKCNEAGDVSMLTMTAGKTKLQFRCTSVALMRAPKSNDDVPVCTIKVTKAEAALIAKASKTLSAETIVLYVNRAGAAKLECSDSAKDKFEIELSNQVKYADEEQSLVQTYLAGLFVDVIDQGTRDTEEIDLIVGEVGSITAALKGHTVMIMPRLTDDD